MARRKGSTATAPDRQHTAQAVFAPPVSRADYVYTVLRQEILDGTLPPGTPILQDEIGARLGVSITPVREALRRLESTGLVSYRTHYGATVTELTKEAVAELYMLRGAVEGLAARLAASRITPGELAELQAIHAAMETARRARDVTRLADGSRQFHGMIAAVGGPALIAVQVRWIQDNYPVPQSNSVWRFDDIAGHAMAYHQALLDAFYQRDGATAQRLMAEHIEQAGDFRQRNRNDDCTRVTRPVSGCSDNNGHRE